MAALSITDKLERSGTFPIVGSGTRITRPLEVTMDDADYHPDEVKQAVHDGGIIYGSVHPTFASAWARNFEVTQNTTQSRVWRVNVEYTSEIDDPNSTQNPDPRFRDPLLDPPVVALDTQQMEFAQDKDADGNEILNYAKRPYDPPLTDWKSVFVLRVSRNEAAVTFATHGPFVNKVNSATWLGAPARHVLCAAIRATKDFRSYQIDELTPPTTVTFWRVDYEFHYLEDDPAPSDANIGPWDHYVLQADVEQIAINGADWEPILDEFGEPVRVAKPIDVSGRAIAANLLPASAVYRGHPRKKATDFNSLGITI